MGDEPDYRAIVELIEDGVALVRRGRTLYCSPRWAKRIGVEETGELGRSCFDLIAQEVKEREKEYDDPDQATSLELEMDMQTAQGERLDVAVKIHPLQLRDGPATLVLLRDISAQKEVERALRLSESRYRLISELTSDFTFALRHDATGDLRTEWVAGAYSRITGYKVGEIWDRGGWMTLIHPEDSDRALELVQTALGGSAADAVIRFVTKDSQTRWVQFFLRPLHDEDTGEVAGIIGAGQDQTEQRATEQALERKNTELLEANRRLEEAHRQKDEITAMVSHELRTPLVTGLGYLEMALSGALGSIAPEIARRLGKALDSLTRLRRLIDALLQYNRFIGAEAVDLQTLRPVDLAQLARDTAAEFLVGSRIPAAQLIMELPDGEVPVRAQPEPMRIVLSNLLNNSAAHAGGDARIMLSIRPGDGRVRVDVSDDGAGVPREIRARLFDLFARPRARPAGLGLGLAIVHAILKSHGALPHLESEPGRGTRVWFELPAA